MNDRPPLKPVAPASAGATTGLNPMRCIDSRNLFGNKDVVLIEHNGEIYTLRKTRNSKLILTK